MQQIMRKEINDRGRKACQDMRNIVQTQYDEINSITQDYNTDK